jgi:lysozyme
MVDVEELSEKLSERLRSDEGFSATLYYDTEGYLTIGFGWCCEKCPMRRDEAELRLKNDIKEAIEEASKNFIWFPDLNEARQEVIANMVFNLGIPRFLKFKKTIEAIKIGNWDLAATEMLDSLWAKQVGSRAARLAKRMREGT